MAETKESTTIDDALQLIEGLATLVDRLAEERGSADIAVPRKKLTLLARKVEYIAAHEAFEAV